MGWGGYKQGPDVGHWGAGPLSGIPSPHLVFHPINESPKWNSSLLDIFLLLTGIEMNTSACVPQASDVTLHLIFERVIPYLMQGLLFGGIPPYILHISDSTKQHGNGKAIFCTKI